MLEQLAQILTLSGFLSLASLTALEIILGIDNVVFIALVIQHLPTKNREFARRIGLSLALIMRVALLFSIAWVMSLTKPLLDVMGNEFSGKDILLLLGGTFLIYKSTTSVHSMFTNEEEDHLREKKGGMTATIVQIVLIDLVFSFDSVITAIGITTNIPVIIIAMTIAMIIMLVFTGMVSDFIFRYPSLKTLAIAFILLIGVLLVGEGFGAHLPRGYIYFAMAFSCTVEIINILIQRKKKKVQQIPNA